MGMAQLAGGDGSHVIDIDVGAECAVCMEPLKWVAIGPCGHREVCSKCTARIRFFQGDRRCCICRAPCPTVFVTKAGGGRRVSSKLAVMADHEGRIGDYCYHNGSATYFDDKKQYKVTKKACVEKRATENDDGGRAPCCCPPLLVFFIFVVVSFASGVAIGYAAASDNKHWSHRVPIM